MQRHSAFDAARVPSLAGAPGLNNGAAPSPSNPITGIYGSGMVRFFTTTTAFIVPPGCTRLRVRGWSPGGGSANGGTVSFGSYVSATGGQAGTVGVSGAGGVATGGDINFDGSAGDNLGNGGGAPSVMGPGGPGPRGGAGAGDEHGFTGAKFDATQSGYGGTGSNQIGISHILDFIATGAGGHNGSNISGTARGGDGANGGGGGGSTVNGGGGRGGFPGGGAGNGASIKAGGSGAFFLKEITGLTPGDSITVTIPAASLEAGGGLIVAEW